MAFACLVMSGSVIDAVSSDQLPETIRIRSIKMTGIRSMKTKEVRSVLAIPPPSAWRIWVKRPTASEEDLADDARRISRFYISSGFYHALVAYDVHIPEATYEETPSAEVIYHIEEGEPVLVDSVVIDLGDMDTPVQEKQLQELIPLKTGMRFEEKAYRESKRLILNKFGSVGYPLAEISGKAMIYTSTNKAVVTFNVMPGRSCYFGETTVIGDMSVLNDKILNRTIEHFSGNLCQNSIGPCSQIRRTH